MKAYPPKPIEGWIEKRDMDQEWTGWKVYANPGDGREPVTITAGHSQSSSGWLPSKRVRAVFWIAVIVLWWVAGCFIRSSH